MRKDAVNKKGESPLVLKLYKDQEVKQITLPKCSVKKENWDEINSQVIGDKMMTMRIHNELAKYEQAFTKLDILEVDYTLADVIDLVKGKKPASIKEAIISNPNVQDILEDYFVDTPKLKYGTRKNYKSLLKLLKEFKMNPKLGEIDGDYLREFVNKMNKKRSYSDWTIHSRIKCLKRAVQFGFEEGMVLAPNWNGYKMKKGESDRNFLIKEEIKILKAFTPESDLDKRILRAFLFSCFTGMRCGDVQVLTYKNFSSELVDEGIGIRLKYKMRKNENIVSTIVSKNVLNFIDTTKAGKKKSVFDFVPMSMLTSDDDTLSKKLEGNNAYINKRLRIIQKRAGLLRTFSYHESRHTFFCQGIILGVNHIVLQELGGLDSTEVLLKHYVHLVENSKTKGMNKFDQI